MSNNSLYCSKCKSQHHPADCPLDSIISESKRGQETKRLDEKEIREYLWLNHGCHSSLVYGDDGEMQCHYIDFKRMPLLDLIKHCKKFSTPEGEKLDEQYLSDTIYIVTQHLNIPDEDVALLNIILKRELLKFTSPLVKLPEKNNTDHNEDGQDCGCAYLGEDTPCQIRREAINEIIDQIKEMNK